MYEYYFNNSSIFLKHKDMLVHNRRANILLSVVYKEILAKCFNF